MKKATNPIATRLSWEVAEHTVAPKGGDWFVAVGIVAVTVSGVAIFFGNYFFAVLVLVAAATSMLIARRDPEKLRVVFEEGGISFGGFFMPHEHIVAYTIDEADGESLLRLKTTHLLRPYVTITMPPYYREAVVAHFAAVGIPQQDITEPATEHISRLIGF